MEQLYVLYDVVLPCLYDLVICNYVYILTAIYFYLGICTCVWILACRIDIFLLYKKCYLNALYHFVILETHTTSMECYIMCASLPMIGIFLWWLFYIVCSICLLSKVCGEAHLWHLLVNILSSFHSSDLNSQTSTTISKILSTILINFVWSAKFD